jgi:uncharacterized protein YbjT (DUF2867 family)
MGISSTQTILVTGATGYIGGRLIPHLLQKGWKVRCLVRDPTRLEGRGWQNIEVFTGDVLAYETLLPALRGVHAAYYLVHSMAAGKPGFTERDLLAAQQFGHAAKAAGVKRIIYLGGLGSDEDTLSQHLKSRHAVGEQLRASGVAVTEFRAGVIIGAGNISFELIRYLSERVPLLICPKWVHTLTQPIFVQDVLRYLVACLDLSETENRIVEIGGSEILSYGQMMLIYAKVRGLRRWLIPVPVLTPRLSSWWVRLVTPLPVSVARPLIDGLKNQAVVQDPTAQQLFPFAPLSYEEALKMVLERRESGEGETTWSGALSSFSIQDTSPQPLHKQAEGLIFERRHLLTQAPATAVFRVLSSLGGENGWLYANGLWNLRGYLDRLVGGIGLRRGRRASCELRVGDPLDFWRVEALLPDRSLRLRAEMKLPGKAWLQFEILPKSPSERCILQTAVYEPKGLGGLLYWYGLYPLHRLIFRGLITAIAQKAEQLTVPMASIESRNGS